MSKLCIPVDSLTHYPLPFLPSPDLPPMPPEGDMRYDPKLAGYHHAIPRPKSDVAKTDIGVQAAIDSRLQWVWNDDHHRYHDQWGEGLGQHFPQTRPRQCHTTIFGLIDYIPEAAIDFSRRVPRVVRVHPRDREQCRQRRQFVLGHNGVVIRRFWLEHSLEQGAAAVNPDLVDEFLDLTSSQRKPERVEVLAGILLQQTVEPLMTPGISQVYGYMKKHEMVRPGIPSALSTLIKNEIRLAFTPERFINKLAFAFSTLRTAAA